MKVKKKFKTCYCAGNIGNDIFIKNSHQFIYLFSDLWSTFYEIVDDTSQIAKSHAILSESISNQIVSPLDETIKTMDLNRRRTLDEAIAVSNELNEAFSILRKATQQLEETTNEVNATRLGLSRAEGAITVKPRELEKARMRYQAASEKLSIARASYRQCEDVCKSLQNKVQMVDIPRISRMLSGLEASRGTEIRTILQSTAKLDKTTAEMDLECASAMERKVAEIVINDGLDCLLMCSGQGNGNGIGNGSEGGPGRVDDIRRYSITRPLISRAATSHPVALQVDPNIAPRSLNNGTTPSPSYYPSETYRASIEALEKKNGSQMIQ